jgi:sugar lactone lactonase YvrE
MTGIERLTDPIFAVGESPVWRAAEAALYWVDIPARRIHRFHVETGRADCWAAAEMVACIAFDKEGAVIAGMESGIFSLELETPAGESTHAAPGAISATQLAAPVFPMQGMRFNDGRCDRQGRFWAGTMHMDMRAAHAVGGLYCYTAGQGLSGPAQAGLLTQNGLAWSPAGDLMYLSDSHPDSRLIWVFDYDKDCGTPRNRRVFVDMNRHTGRPDGAAVDADGCYWTCANDAGQLLRFTPGGKLDRSVPLPVRKPSMCAFGGAAFDTLFVTSIRPREEAELVDQPLAGAVFALRPGIRGLPESEFG